MKILLTLGSILSLGPIFGFFGTIIGMIGAFNTIAAEGIGSAEMLAEDISFALVTTQIGLLLGIVGVVALIFGHVLKFRKEVENEKDSEKAYLPCMLLNLFLGVIGAHHFYAGRVRLGIVYLLTLGGFMIGKHIDFILLAWGEFKDSEGKRIRHKTANQSE